MALGEAMKLWALEFYSGDDECSCNHFLGVFLTETEAIGASIKHFEMVDRWHRPDSLDDYRTFEIEVGSLTK